MARIFYDCEFIEDGTTIELVSLGAVDEAGREFYAVSRQFDALRAGPWVRRNVLDKLPPASDPVWRSRLQIREAFYEFVTAGEGEAELWAWNAPYDHVVIAQLWGAMPDLPRALPRFTRDLRQRWDDVGRPALPAAPRRRPRRARRRPAQPAQVGGHRRPLARARDGRRRGPRRPALIDGARADGHRFRGRPPGPGTVAS